MFHSWLTALSVFNLSWFWDWQLYLFVYISELTIMSVLVFGSTIDDFVCFSHVWFSDRRVFLTSLCLVREWRLCLSSSCMVLRLTNLSVFPMFGFRIILSVSLMFGSQIDDFVCLLHVCLENEDFVYFLPTLFWVLRFCLSSSCFVLRLVVFLSLSCLVLRMTTLTALLMFGSEFDDFVGFAQVWFWNKMRNSSKIQSDDVVWFSVCIVLRHDAVCIPRV
jgi:hypothetical protein